MWQFLAVSLSFPAMPLVDIYICRQAEWVWSRPLYLCPPLCLSSLLALAVSWLSPFQFTCRQATPCGSYRVPTHDIRCKLRCTAIASAFKRNSTGGFAVLLAHQLTAY